MDAFLMHFMGMIFYARPKPEQEKQQFFASQY
jgi:hypothetical protein